MCIIALLTRCRCMGLVIAASPPPTYTNKEFAHYDTSSMHLQLINVTINRGSAQAGRLRAHDRSSLES